MTQSTRVPFDGDKLDALQDAAGIDLVLASSRHNARYLAGGYYNWFHSRIARATTKRYMSYVGVPRGRQNEAFFVGGKTEGGHAQAAEMWVPDQVLTEPPKSPFFQSSEAATEDAIECIKKRGLDSGRIALELAYLPANAYETLRQELPNAQIVDATALLGELRAVKSPAELDILRRNAAASIESIQTTVRSCEEGITSREIQYRLQSEMALRGIEMQWLIICMGTDGLRIKWPCDQAWARDEILRIDPGTSHDDYIVDLSRMACLGEPSDLANQIIAECIDINDKLQAAIRPGLTCGELAALGEKLRSEASYPEYGWHITHGCGMVPHEPPVVSGDPDYVLAEGMVMSMETEFQHPEVGDIKVEDFVAVTADGCENFAATGRNWTLAN